MPAGIWGVPPFFIERAAPSPLAAPRGPDFTFQAPTASRNAMRILRALQVPKAVLLEGSPGVGKSSIVAAMARAAGEVKGLLPHLPCSSKHLSGCWQGFLRSNLWFQTYVAHHCRFIVSCSSCMLP